jgi:hypothetical protein
VSGSPDTGPAFRRRIGDLRAGVLVQVADALEQLNGAASNVTHLLQELARMLRTLEARARRRRRRRSRYARNVTPGRAARARRRGHR